MTDRHDRSRRNAPMNLVAAYTAGRLLAELDWRLQQACLAPRPEENVVHDVFGRFSLEGRRVVAGHPDQVVLEDAIHRGWATLNVDSFGRDDHYDLLADAQLAI